MRSGLSENLASDTAVLNRIRPERNERRFYAIFVMGDLFGYSLVVRNWGRIGTGGRLRIDSHPDANSAATAIVHLVRRKRRRGYHDREDTRAFSRIEDAFTSSWEKG